MQHSFGKLFLINILLFPSKRSSACEPQCFVWLQSASLLCIRSLLVVLTKDWESWLLPCKNGMQLSSGMDCASSKLSSPVAPFQCKANLFTGEPGNQMLFAGQKLQLLRHQLTVEDILRG